MGRLEHPHKVKLIVGLLSGETVALDKAKRMLAGMFGKIDFESPLLDFTYSSYYSEEMGDNLKRKFLSFEKLFSLKGIYRVKLKTNSLEKKFLNHKRRVINIDPGYLDLAKLVLFSTKDYAHRIYLDGGIFSEVTLFYKDKRFNAWPWTYPDYKSEEYLGIFNSIRSLYKDKR